jgi:nuclear GTP-binding protein
VSGSTYSINLEALLTRNLEPTSKRVSVRLRHSVAKASAAKQRKGKKLAKKDVTWKSKLKKDPGIPNLFPYKDKILAEIEENRRRKDEETVRRKALAKAQDQGLDIAADAMVDDEDDVEDKDNSLDLDSEDENSMQVVRAFCFSSLGYLYQH